MKMLLLILALFVNNNSLDKQVRGYLTKHLSDYQKFEYEILASPKTSDTIELQDDKEFNISKNMVYIPVKVASRNSVVSSVISVKVKLYKNVLVANQVIRSRTDLNEAMFESRLVEVTSLRGTPVEDAGLVKSLRNKKIINTGEVLIEESCENMPIIFTGDEVTAVKNIGSVTITVQAFAREDGAAGDKIKIRTIDNKQFTAKIIDRKKVFIEE